MIWWLIIIWISAGQVGYQCFRSLDGPAQSVGEAIAFRFLMAILGIFALVGGIVVLLNDRTNPPKWL